ncbi:MAG: PKD domain-containing protein, partial [Myxococcota bacterium]
MHAVTRLAALCALAIVAISTSPAAHAATDVFGNITSNTTWTAAASPYVLHNDVAVNEGVTLTLQDGVSVVVASDANGSGGLDGSRVEFTVRGTLNAGTPLGADIEFDSGKASPAEGDWFGIVIASTATGSALEGAAVRNSRYGFYMDGAGASAITFDDVRVQKFSTQGVWVGNGASIALTGLTIDDSLDATPETCIHFESAGTATHKNLYLAGCSVAVRLNDTNATFEDTIVRDSKSNAFYLTKASATSRSLTLKRCTLNKNGTYAIAVYDSGSTSGSASVNLIDSVSHGSTNTFQSVNTSSSTYYANVSYTNSVIGDSSVGSTLIVGSTTGSVLADPLFANLDPGGTDLRPTTRSPLRNSAAGGGTIGALPYDPANPIVTPGTHGFYWEDATWSGATVDVGGDVVVMPGVTLTVAAGTTVRFAKADLVRHGTSIARAELEVRGTLVAQGTAGSRIEFGSAAASPTDTDWYGIHVGASPAVLDLGFVTIRDASRGLWLEGSALQLSNVELTACDYCVYVESGTPKFTDFHVHDADRGFYILDSAAGAVDLHLHHIGNTAVSINRSVAGGANVFTRALIHDVNRAFQIDKPSASSVSLTVDHSTIAHVTGDAFYGFDSGSTSGSISIDVNASVIANCGGYAFFGANGSSSTYYPSVTWSYTNIWGNVGTQNSYVIGAASTGSLSYNPLFADPDARDYQPTHRSPLRYSDGADGTIGAVAFSGAQTPGYIGFYWENYQFNPGNYVIDGDIIITGRKIPGSGLKPDDPADDVPAKITTVPGVVLKMKKGDVMGGGASVSRVEFVNHGILEMDGISFLPVKVTSNEAVPAKGDWYGVVVAADAHATNVSEAELSFASYGVRVEGSTHIVKNIDTHDNTVGVYIEGGNPTVQNVEAHHNDYGLQVIDSSPTIEALLAHHNVRDGLWLQNTGGTSRHIPMTRSLLYANGDSGVYLQKDSSGSLTLSATFCTIADNADHGVEGYDSGSTSGAVQANLTACAVTGNTLQGFYGGNGSSSTYYLSVSVNSSDVWGNASQSNPYVFYSDGGSNFEYNPLYKDPANGDYTPTDRSPLRCAAANGTDAAGARVYNGDPTGKLTGYLHGDFTLTAAGSPYDIPGDLIVDNKCSATPARLTIEPGAILRFAANTDLMGGGVSAARTELRVVDELRIDGTAAQVQLVSSNAATPGKTDWYGLVLDAASSVIMKGFLIANANIGIRGQTTAGNIYGPGEIRDGSGWAVNFEQGTGATLEKLLLRNFTSGGVYMNAVTGNPVLRHSIVLDTGAYAVRVQDTSIDVIGNVLMGASYGFYGTKTGATSIVFDLWNNTIHEHKSDCVYTNDSLSSGTMSLLAKNNLLSYCQGYAFNDPGTYDVVYSGQVDFNNFFETLNYKTGSSHNGLVKGASSTSVNPRYEDIDPSGTRRWYDLRLLHDSPMIEAGIGVGALIPTLDLLNVTRPAPATCAGGSPIIDRGAYEYDACANHDPWAAAGADQLVPMLDLACFDASATTDPDVADGPGLVYQWTFGDGKSAGGKFVCHTFTANIIHEVILTVTDAHGGVDHDVLMVDVNHRPVADAGPEIYAAAGGDAAAFDGKNSYDPDGTVQKYLWDFGDGSPTSASAAPSYQYPPGPTQDFLVTLTVTDNDGHTDSDTTIAHVIGTDDTVGPLITHTKIANGQPSGVGVVVNASISDFSGVTATTLYYRVAGAASWSEVVLGLIGGSSYQATIPSGSVTAAGVDYYIAATDGYAPPNVSTHPASAPTTFHSFTVLPVDNVGPSIVHTPVANGQAEGADVQVDATVTDTTGVASVSLYYKVATGSTYASVDMTDLGDGHYRASVPGVVVTSAGVRYYIRAVDTAAGANTSTHPAGAPGSSHLFGVDVTDTTGPTIVHTPIPNGQIENTDIPVSATITDASGVQVARLHYRQKGTSTFAAVTMTKSGNTYSATIPKALVKTAGVDYFLSADDDSLAHNTAVAPNTAPSVPYTFTVTTTDTSGPSIAHTPVPGSRPAGVDVGITAGVVDSSGVASVTLHYRALGAGSFTVQAMVKGAGDSWTGTIPGSAVNGAALQYYLSAVDSSPNANTASAPASGATSPYQFTVVVADTAGPTILHDPISGSKPVGQPVVLSATVTDTSGVNSVTAYYRKGTGAWTPLPMTASGGGGYTASIPGAAVGTPSMDYYLLAIDASASLNQSASPPTAPALFHTFAVAAADTTPPEITHEKVADGQQAGQAVDVAATVTDASGVSSVKLFYRPVGEATYISVTLTGSGGLYSGQIPSFGVTAAGVQYYLEATDTAGNKSTVPAAAPSTVYTFTATVADGAGPTITATPIANGKPAGVGVAVSATVTDSSGVATVKLFHRISGTSVFASLSMTAAGNVFSATIPGGSVGLPGVDWYIEAADASPAGNVSRAPATAPGTPASFTVTAPDTTGPAIVHTAIADGQAEATSVVVSAQISDASGVATATTYVRATGGTTYTALAMSAVGGGTWQAIIPGALVTPAGVDYYLEARDASAAANLSALPAGGAAAPYSFDVDPADDE